MIVTLRRKPIVIQGVRWAGSAEEATEVINWILSEGGTARYDEGDPDVGVPESIAVDSPNGTMRAVAGDYVLQNVEDKFYVQKSYIVEEMYDHIDIAFNRVEFIEHEFGDGHVYVSIVFPGSQPRHLSTMDLSRDDWAILRGVLERAGPPVTFVRYSRSVTGKDVRALWREQSTSENDMKEEG